MPSRRRLPVGPCHGMDTRHGRVEFLPIKSYGFSIGGFGSLSHRFPTKPIHTITSSEKSPPTTVPDLF